MNNLFGTDGIRGLVGTVPFTASTLTRLGNALGLWIINRYGLDSSIIVGQDTRISGSFVKSALLTGILQHPISVIDTGVVPTPALLAIIKQKKFFSCALMISASHNPYHDNGIKLITHETGKISR
jgi:phosphoglucosamine mutase